MIGKFKARLKKKCRKCKSNLEERVLEYEEEENSEATIIVVCPKCMVEVEPDIYENKKKERRDREIRRKRDFDEWN